MFVDYIPEEQSLNSCASPVEEEEASFWTGMKKLGQTSVDVVKGTGTGLYKVGEDLVTGVVDMVTNPGDALKSTYEAFSHPVQTFRAIESAISESYERDVINGDAYSRANWFSYALGTTVTSVVGTKGLGAVGKTGVATTKSVAQTGIAATKNATSSIANLLPYAPRPQLAMVGDVPFNALNGAGLKDQLISMARVNRVDDLPRIKEIGVSFKRNVKHDSEEFARQLKDQEKGMNELTVDEYLKNRDRYIAEGRAIEGNAAQKMARQEALKDKIAELRKQGLSRVDATKQASEWMETKAALHNPDQIAGGRADNIGGLGDKRVNSSIGSQWKYRIDVVDDQIRENAKNMSPEQLKNTYLNVKLTQ